MQIRNVAASFSDPTTSAKRGDAVEAGGVVASAVDRLSASSAGATGAMAEILARYDVTDISPNEFSRMIQELSEAGALSQQELQQLAAVRLDLDNAGVEPDESIDLLEFYAEKIEKQQRQTADSDEPAANGQQLGPLLGRLDWLEKFALIQSAPDSAGLDAVA